MSAHLITRKRDHTMKHPVLHFLIAATLCTSFAGCAAAHKMPERYGMVVGLKKEKLEEYKALHADPWQGVLDQIDRSHMRNFSIWLVELRPEEYYLFGYFEYDGDDLEADMAKMAEDATTRRWWKRTDPCQQPIPTAPKDKLWVMMDEIFYHDRDHPDARRMPPQKGERQMDVGKAK